MKYPKIEVITTSITTYCVRKVLLKKGKFIFNASCTEVSTCIALNRSS